MADDKKPKGKPKDAKPEGGGNSLGLDVLLWILILLFIFFTIVPYIGGKLGLGSDNFSNIGSQISSFAISLFTSLEFISVFVSLLFVMAIIFVKFKASERAHLQKIAEAENISEFEKVKNAPAVNPKWQKVLSHVNSGNEGDWRLSIIEADIILGEMLDKMGYIGIGIGDKLKQVEKSDFATIDNAWEAHKIRNTIAHEGSDYELSQREARRVIDLYRSVFEEFYFI